MNRPGIDRPGNLFSEDEEVAAEAERVLRPIFRDRKLSPFAKLVMTVLVDHGDYEPAPPADAIAQYFGGSASVRSVKRALRRLAARGWIDDRKLDDAGWINDQFAEGASPGHDESQVSRAATQVQERGGHET